MGNELISLSEAKSHMRLEDDFDYEDEIIRAYLDASIEVCQRRIGKQIPDEQPFTAAIKIGCLMYTTFLHENRSAVSEIEKTEVPMAISALWDVYRDPGVY